MSLGSAAIFLRSKTRSLACSSSKANGLITEVSEYISQHYQEDLSVAELAEKFHMSYSYFAAIFKEYYGQTCKEMILTVRLQKAEDLLQFTDFDLTYISQETGFCDCSHFIKAFKQKYGVTPRKYRMKEKSFDFVSRK